MTTHVVLATTARAPGGLWRHVRDLATELTARGRDVTVALHDDADLLRAAAHEAGLRTTTFSGFLAEADRRCSLLHVHLADTYDREAFRLILSARLRRLRIVVTEHLPRTNASDWSLRDATSRRMAFALKGLFKRAEFAMVRAVIAVSRGSGDFLSRRYGLPSRKLHTITNGILDKSPGQGPRAAEWSNGECLSVICVASLIRQKGVDLLIEAASLARGRWRAVVVGDGPQRERLATLAEDLVGRAGATVEICGWVDDVESRLRKADALVMPSRWEAFPYAALEAMSQGLPVIGCRVDGLDELVVRDSDGRKSGVLVPTEDAQSLARVLDDLSEDPERCAQMAAAATRIVRQNTLDAMVTLTDTLYEAVVSGA